MSAHFSQFDSALRRAGQVLLFEVAAGLVLAILLSRFGFNAELAIIFLWVANLPAAWFLAQAARHQGRNAWLFGFMALPPLTALILFWSLSATNRAIRRSNAA